MSVAPAGGPPAPFFFFDPAPAGEQGNCDHDTEKRLPDGGVGRGYRGRKRVQDGDAAQDALNDHQSESGQAQLAHPRTAIGRPGPNGEHDRQQAREFGHHAVSVFELHSADHGRHAIERAERGWPIRHRKARVVAGDQRARNDQEKSRDRDHDGEPVKAAMIGDRRFQNPAPCSCGTAPRFPGAGRRLIPRQPVRTRQR